MKGATEEKCACERVCMKDALLQSIKDIEPTTHQLTCSPNVNKMVKCVVLRQSLLTRCLIKKKLIRQAEHRNTLCEQATSTRATLCLGREGSGLRERRGEDEATPPTPGKR